MVMGFFRSLFGHQNIPISNVKATASTGEVESGGGAVTSPSPPSPPVTESLQPSQPIPASNPTLAEFVALLHNQNQQVIEYLAQPELHQISKNTASSSLVKIERIKMNIPINVLSESVKITSEQLTQLKNLQKPIFLPDGRAYNMRITISDLMTRLYK